MNPHINTGRNHGLPPSEQSMADQMIAYREERAKQARAMFPNAPEETTCKLCGVKFPNPILNGASIVTVTCEGCRMNMLGDRAKKKAVKEGRVSKRDLQRAENAVSEAPAVIGADPEPVGDLPPFYLCDFGEGDDE